MHFAGLRTCVSALYWVWGLNPCTTLGTGPVSLHCTCINGITHQNLLKWHSAFTSTTNSPHPSLSCRASVWLTSRWQRTLMFPKGNRNSVLLSTPRTPTRDNAISEPHCNEVSVKISFRQQNIWIKNLKSDRGYNQSLSLTETDNNTGTASTNSRAF